MGHLIYFPLATCCFVVLQENKFLLSFYGECAFVTFFNTQNCIIEKKSVTIDECALIIR